MKKKTINHVLIDLRNASSQINKHRHLSTSNVIITRTHGAFVNVLSEEELRFLEFSVSTARESLHDIAISMEKASILLQQNDVCHNTAQLRNRNRELLIMCTISMGDIMRVAYAHDRAEFARTSHEFNSALRALKYCMMTSRNAYTILCKRQTNTSNNVLK